MNGYLNKCTGAVLGFPDAIERYKIRLARMRHNVWLGVCMLQELIAKAGGRLVMFTLTYASLGDWAPRHMSNMVRWLRRQNVKEYVWVAELQKRGAIHYHLLARFADGQRWRKPGAEKGGWSHGFTWVTDGVTKPFYIMKYLQKGSPNATSSGFPKGARLYAVCQQLIRASEFKAQYDWRDGHLPAWSRDDGKDTLDRISSRRVAGGVSYRGWTELSPYTRRPFADLDRIDWQMKRNIATCGIVSQR